MYLAFFPSPACAFFNFLPTIGTLDVTNREVVDREAMDGVRAGATGAGIVGSDTPPTNALAAKVADVARNARAEVCDPVASCARPLETADPSPIAEWWLLLGLRDCDYYMQVTTDYMIM